MIALTARRAQQVADALATLNRITRDTDLHIGNNGLEAALVDADGSPVCRLDYDAEAGSHLAREAY